MAEPRSYVVGLPVVITVHDTDPGTVTYEVATEEAGQAIRELLYADGTDLGSTEGSQVVIDAAAVEYDHTQVRGNGRLPVTLTDWTEEGK